LAEIGTTLGGRYRLVELLGQGGMATIFRATDLQLGRDVAVKLLRPEYLRDPDFSSRFRTEARSAASTWRRSSAPTGRCRLGRLRASPPPSRGRWPRPTRRASSTAT